MLRWQMQKAVTGEERRLYIYIYINYHEFHIQNNHNHKTTHTKFTVQSIIAWEYMICVSLILVCFIDKCSKRPLGEVLPSVAICFVTSLFKHITDILVGTGPLFINKH